MKISQIYILLFLCILNILTFQHKKAHKKFQLLTYYEINEKLEKLAQKYPNFAKLQNGDYEGLPHTKCEQERCKFNYLTLTNFTNPEHKKFTQSFFSGNFHGNEQQGPNVLVYLCEFILEDALDILNYSYIVIIPLSNPSGYMVNKREEQQQNEEIDMNRDFPYFQDPKSCFKTAGARVVNRLWQNHIFQASITYHSGMYAIGWPYGAPNRLVDDQINVGQLSPDQKIFYQYGKRMADLAGSSKYIEKYPYDTLTNAIYAVPGTFEDWSYAGSWEPQVMKDDKLLAKCENVPEEELEMNDVMARSLTYLIEAGEFNYDKDQQGTWEQITDQSKGIGHISRNIRLTFDLIKNLTPKHTISNIDKDKNTLKFQLQGCYNVDKTRVFFRQDEPIKLQHHIKFNKIEDLLEQGFNEGDNFESFPGVIQNDQFFQTYQFQSNTKQLIFVTQCDSDWAKTVPDSQPKGLDPQTHVARRKIYKDYHVKYKKFSVESKYYIFDNILIDELPKQVTHHNGSHQKLKKVSMIKHKRKYI